MISSANDCRYIHTKGVSYGCLSMYYLQKGLIKVLVARWTFRIRHLSPGHITIPLILEVSDMRPFRVVKHSIHTKSWYIDVLEGRALTLVCTALSNQDQLLQHIAHKVDTGPHFITLSAIIRNSATLSRRDAWANLQNVHVVHADTILRCGVVYPELEVGSLYTYGEGQGCLAKIRSGRGAFGEISKLVL